MEFMAISRLVVVWLLNLSQFCHLFISLPLRSFVQCPVARTRTINEELLCYDNLVIFSISLLFS
jgi:hypothetical protein